MESSPAATDYSIENARKFGWASIGGPLSREKLQVLDKYVIGPKLLDAGCGAYPLLSSVYKRLFRFLLLRCQEPSLFLNLAAIVDFDKKDAPAPELAGG